MNTMNSTATIKIELAKVDLLWFEIYTDENPDSESFLGKLPDDEPDDPCNPMFVLTCGYDFAFGSEQVRELYLDPFVKLPDYATMKFRFHYRAEEVENMEWDDLFVTDRLKVLVENAFESGLQQFRSVCEAKGVKLPLVMLNHKPDLPTFEIDKMTEHLIEDYFTLRKPFMQKNAEYFNSHAITIPSRQNWVITMHLTMLIMEEVLFHNLHFDRKNNRESFFDVVPEALFFTLRNKCIQLAQHELVLNQMELHYFLIAQDCALQMAMGENGDALQPLMVSRGFTEEVQKIWCKGASGLVENCRGGVEASIASGEKFDWCKILG